MRTVRGPAYRRAMSVEPAAVAVTIAGVGVLLQGAALLLINSPRRRSNRDRWREDLEQARTLAGMAHGSTRPAPLARQNRQAGHAAGVPSPLIGTPGAD